MENPLEDYETHPTVTIPDYLHPKSGIPENVLSKVTDYILISGIDFPDQIFDRSEWLDDVIDRNVLLVDENFSAEDCDLYTHATFTGVETSRMFSKYQINEEQITTVEFHSNISRDDKDKHLKIPLSVLLSQNVGAMLAFKCNSRVLDIYSGGPFRLVIPGYLTSDRYGSIFAMELTQNRNIFPIEIPIMSFLTVPENSTVVRARDEVVLEGLAFAGSGKRVLSVEYSLDNHQSWTSCFLGETSSRTESRDLDLSSRLFHFKFSLELRLIPKSAKLSIKATDQNWVSQPVSKTKNLACPYDNSCFTLLIKDHPNSQRVLLYPGFQETDHFLPDKSASPFIQTTGHLAESKKALKTHFVENVLPVQKKGVHNLQVKNNTVQRTVGGYKKREMPSEKKLDISAQTDYKNDMKKDEKWRKILDKKVEIELRPVDERKRHPFHSQFLPKIDKKGKNKEKAYSREEVRQHNTVEDCWIIIREQVYDVTELVKSHPGGAELFMAYAGAECSYAFEATHERQVTMLLDDYYVGKLQEFVNKALVSNFVLPQWSAVTLVSKVQLTPDTYEFSFRSKSAHVRVPLGSHFFLYISERGDKVCRPYNLIKIGEDERDLVFAIKIYRKSSINPQGGKFTCMLDKLRKGDVIRSYGPVSHMDYLGKSYVDVKGQRCSINRLVMIVGGSGITPMINLMDTFLPKGHEVCLISCNRTEDDIIYKTKLNSYAKQYPNFSLHYTIEIVPVTAQYRWNYFSGLLNEKHLKKSIKNGRKDDFVFLCGRVDWLKEVKEMLMTQFEYTNSQFIQF